MSKQEKEKESESDEYSLSGVIIDPGKYVRNADRTIFIQTSRGNKYKCIIPPQIFSNFQEDDIIECRVTKNEDGKSFTMIRTPFTQFGVDRDNVERCFIRALKGTGFGGVSAGSLYDGLKNIAKRTGYTDKEQIDDEGIVKSIESTTEKEIQISSQKSKIKINVKSKNNTLPVKKKTDEEDKPKKKLVKKKDNESDDEEDDKFFKNKEKSKIPGLPISTTKIKLKPEIVGYDGVIPLMTELSTRYNKTGSKDPIETIVSCGARENQAQSLLQWWYKSRSLRRLHLLGFTNKQIKECRMDLDVIYQTVLENPFRLAPLSIETCIGLMTMLNKETTPEHIACGEILRKIYAYVEGMAWTCVPVQTLEYNFKNFFKYIGKLQDDYGVILDGRLVYLEYNYAVEIFVANFIDDLIKKTAKIMALPTEDTASVQTANYTLKTLTEEQKLAINGALHSNVCVITGAAGTGKSSICKEIHKNLELRGMKMAACAFTGKAVTRLNKCLGEKIAKTMDLMIMRSSQIEPFDVLLIDESSMVTTELIYRFKKAFPFDFSIISVGDCNQLPPITWGFFMKQIIASERVPIYTLTKNQRLVQHHMTAEDEKKANKENKDKEPASIDFDRTILENCETLIDPKRDLSFPMEFKEGPGFYTLDGNIDVVENLLEQLADHFEAEQITCISPYNEYIKPINEMFQNIFLPDVKTVVDRKGRIWKLGDRVMMLKNNYNINIMNGDEGQVIDLDDQGVRVKFEDGTEHLFNYVSKNGDATWLTDISADSGGNGMDFDETNWDGEELICDMIRQSFCVSVHKSQGSEYPVVILFVPERKNKKGGMSSFLNINLLYTSITRTKRVIWSVAPPGGLGQISITKMPIRYDNLAGRLLKMKDSELEKSLEGLTKIKYVRELTEDNDDDDIPPDDDFYE